MLQKNYEDSQVSELVTIVMTSVGNDASCCSVEHYHSIIMSKGGTPNGPNIFSVVCHDSTSSSE